MRGLVIRPVAGTELLSRGADIRRVYADAFSRHPWNEDATVADTYIRRLADDVTRPGFVAALAFDAETVVGMATAWTTSAPFPSGRCYPQAAAALGAERTADWLCGGREVDELAVAGAARGRGVGAALLHAVTGDAPDGRCWLLTSVRAPDVVRFYRRLGWAQATHPAPEGNGIAVFLGPAHPARPAVVGTD
ncbi:GNAT family N-acetyltransferase [Streptomyces crystallinus]|uniref:GNAT family N-acetyltransferase n=1 Tax=Streptomyces crystallinus TaxID=68191 RepID=A0ABP3QL64_9ACTN